MKRAWSVLRVLLSAALALLAGLIGAEWLFGDRFAAWPLAAAVAFVLVAHAVAAALLALLAGRWWGVATMAAWGGVLVGAVYVKTGVTGLGVACVVGVPVAVGLGAWCGGRLARPAVLRSRTTTPGAP